MQDKLAIMGGSPVINYNFARYNPISEVEANAVQAVMNAGILSKFIGCWDPDFYGGEKVQEFERAWEKYFGVKHAISVNSNTSGLMAAIGAIGIEPGDEVIVSPWTMCASATAILIWNAIPVFADIDPETFNLDPQSIEKVITPYTKAIMVTDIFGHAANLDAIMAIAKKYNLKVIEDCAQAPGAYYKNKYVGTIADIGVFSLNYHKHIHTGEGGVCVTNDDELAERMQLIRNHAEAVVEDKKVTNIANMIGFNFRLTEMQAAIGIEQLKKLAGLVARKQACADKLSAGIKHLPGLTVPVVQADCTHAYYVYPLKVDTEKLGTSRKKIVDALIAEGVPGLSEGYVNVHMLPMYQRKIAFGKQGYPWTAEFYKGDISYAKGICPVAEQLHDRDFIGMEICSFDYTDKDIELIVTSFKKVWSQLNLL